MGACSSKKTNFKLERSQAQKHIEIDFVKLMEYNRKKEVTESKQNNNQQSFCQIFLQDHKASNPQTYTQNLAPTAQLDCKKV